MRFPLAKAKLDQARVLIDSVNEAYDSITYTARFVSAVTALRAVTNALQKDGAHFPGFKVWYEPWQKEMGSDELLLFVHDSRIEDFHEGGGAGLLYFPQFNLKQLAIPRDVEPPADPKAMLKITSEGMVWVSNRGTPEEYRTPARPRAQAEGRFGVGLTHPPKAHLGTPISEPRPSVVLALALAYLQRLVSDAERFFSK